MPKPRRVTSYEEVMALETGEAFSIRLPKTMSWKERHGVLYRTANREVTVTLRSGEKITGRLDKSPGYFSRGTKAGARVWLRVPGRKTRKPVPAEEISHWVGYKAPSLAEAVTALVYLSASAPTEEQVAEARKTASLM